MAIATILKLDIEQRLNITIDTATAVSGGSINQVYCLHTSQGKALLKVNSRSRFPDMFKREGKGLQAIAATNTIATPGIILQGDAGNDSYLLLQWIGVSRIARKGSERLGAQLAEMHRHTSASFGFDFDNYMGSLPQSNTQHTNWCEFFLSERLLPMVAIANGKNLLSETDKKHLEQLFKKLPELIPNQKPSLVHGDLWSGNYLIDDTGTPYLIDPAVSYSSREFDIAMTTLFGGFDPSFYQAYHQTFPLDGGWQDRLALYNLYPLLLHLNLFGNTYLQQVRQTISMYL